MNILIVKTSAIGDVIHTLPSLWSLRAHYPDAQITWLVEEAAADLLIGHPAVNRVLVAARKGWLRDFRSGRVLRALSRFARFVRELRDTRYDLVIDFQGLLKSAMWVLLSRGSRKVGFGKGMEHAEHSYLVLNERVPAVDMNQHAIERSLLLLKGIGVPAADLRYGIPISAEHDFEAAALLRACGVREQDRIIAINPMARWPTKLWEARSFAALADRLEGEGVCVVFTGGTGDAPALDEIGRLMTRRHRRLDGQTNLKQLAAVYRRAQVVVTTDSGPMHLAAAVGTPVVALFGPTAPWRTGPYGPNHAVLRAAVSCSPCFKKQCVTRDYEERACMKRLSIDQVAQAVMEKLAAAPLPASS
ncbi:MAG TPA: lipopolysaccharide heptosyltransferase I [Nitrospira sp.]|nr:lipopolysaccharide heptosyltransferase I [Nitrospira sp.]